MHINKQFSNEDLVINKNLIIALRLLLFIL